jgi:enamine deaminase RidA (YjgF/YER057c/UK114 family)
MQAVMAGLVSETVLNDKLTGPARLSTAPGREVPVSAIELVIPKGMQNIYDQKRYAPGTRAGNLLFVSGMLGRDENLNVIADPEAQFVQVFENTAKVLQAAGAGFADVVEFVGYFTHLRRDFPLFQKVKDRYIARDFPAQTAIGVVELSTPGLLLELKCVALVPDGARR